VERGSNLLVNVYQSGSVFKIKQQSDISDAGIAAAGTGQVSLSAAQPRDIDVDLQAASSVQLEGLLRGDVDGSWTPLSSV
jgi:hypothetical protein